MVIERQDIELDELGQTVGVIGHIAREIGTELDDQDRLAICWVFHLWLRIL